MFDENMFRKYRKIMFHLSGSKQIAMGLITALMFISTCIKNIYKTARTSWFMFGATLKPLCVGDNNYCFIIILK